ncbi:ATP-binding protein [Leifsonia naganoensis]|uniref:ATP-dependent DNA helicase RecG n=1 Tax=Leifsonia naganoensis TaxID=150025 RepID=A0A853DSJ2_9MICO|nr:ATP-binding protein [Leifsonia naganoensis]NYK09040.1 ATP-dependent DNA helicase RecG [Leifsonia naganoensis]
MTTNQVDGALGSGADSVGTYLLNLDEDQWFDRKSVRTDPVKLAQPMVAFANAEGGVLVVGLHGGKVEGTNSQPKRFNDLKQAAIDFTVPPVHATVDRVACVNDAGEEDALIVIRVDSSERVHETQNGDCYLRVGDESRKLRHDLRQELEYDKGQSQYDGMPLKQIAVPDLDGSRLDDYRVATGTTNTIEKLLKARGLLTHQGEVTNAAYLLFADQPQAYFPEAYVRVIRYGSVERGTGSRLTIEDEHDYRIEGPIPQVIADAAAVIEPLIPRRRALRESGRFEAEPIVPRDAWLEGLVNAVVHRSYSLAGDHIRFEIFPDRVEIESPGRFPGLANPSRPLDISRFARNPRIARVCADLAIGQELGEGIKRIFDEMRNSGLTDPVYRQGQGSVHLKLQAVARLDSKTLERLPKRSEEILAVLRAADGGMGTGEIAEASGMSRPTVKQRLDALRTEGLVEWSGKSPRDPRALWSVPELD